MPTQTQIQIPKDFAFSDGLCVDLPHKDTSLTIESAADRVTVLRNFEITRDAKGLALALEMAQVLAQCISVLKAEQEAGKLPASLELVAPTVRDNPFSDNPKTP